jgi:uncharacterized protein (DUF2147 family)
MALVSRHLNSGAGQVMTMRKLRSRCRAMLAGLFAGLIGCVIGVASLGPLHAAEPSAAGLWQKLTDGKPELYVLVVDHNGVFEGVMAKLFLKPTDDPNPICTGCTDDRKNAPWQGISFIRDMKRNGLVYENGNVLDPRDGKVYSAKMTVSADGQSLILRGFIGIALFGKDEIWTRLPDTAMKEIDPAIIQKYLPAQAASMKQPAGKKAAPAAPAPAPR